MTSPHRPQTEQNSKREAEKCSFLPSRQRKIKQKQNGLSTCWNVSSFGVVFCFLFYRFRSFFTGSCGELCKSCDGTRLGLFFVFFFHSKLLFFFLFDGPSAWNSVIGGKRGSVFISPQSSASVVREGNCLILVPEIVELGTRTASNRQDNSILAFPYFYFVFHLKS